MAVMLSILESAAMAIGFGNTGYFENGLSLSAVIISVVSLTAGATFLMWLGERITEKGVGNGISIILLINILSRIPEDLLSLYNKFVLGATSPAGKVTAAVVIVAIFIGCRKKNFCSVCEKVTGKKDGWRSVFTHSIESKYCRCNSCNLCWIFVIFPNCNF